MFNGGFKSEKKTSAAPPATTLLGEGTRWIGELQAGTETLRVDGELEGILICAGTVQVEAQGQIRGTIQSRNLMVTGRVDGFIRVDERLEVLRHGWIEGDVEMGTLVVDEGGTLQGTCNRLVSGAREPLPLVPRKTEPSWSEAPHAALPEASGNAKTSATKQVAPTGRGRY